MFVATDCMQLLLESRWEFQVGQECLKSHKQELAIQRFQAPYK